MPMSRECPSQPLAMYLDRSWALEHQSPTVSRLVDLPLAAQLRQTHFEHRMQRHPKKSRVGNDECCDAEHLPLWSRHVNRPTSHRRRHPGGWCSVSKVPSSGSSGLLSGPCALAYGDEGNQMKASRWRARHDHRSRAADRLPSGGSAIPSVPPPLVRQW
jgi:hypothetical protein